MKYPKQCDRLAAFYLAYELVRWGKPTCSGYSTQKADDWGRGNGLQPVPGPGATEAVIEAWERKLVDVLTFQTGAKA